MKFHTILDDMEKDQTDTNNEKISENQITDNENSEVETNSKNEINELSPEEKILDLEDKLTRSFAEMENQRRRFEKEKEDAFDYGGFALAREALNLIDNLQRSKESLENDDSLKDTKALKKILEHIDVINKDLLSIFQKNNINPIDSIDKKMDPNFHQAMIEIEDNEKEPGTIVQEIQKGFMIKDRLLRPSLVGVSKKSPNIDKKIDENEDKSKVK